MGSTLRWDLGEKDGKVGMGLGAGFVATGVEHQQDDGEQADRRACDAGDLLPRVATQPDFYECRFCPWAKRCWAQPA